MASLPVLVGVLVSLVPLSFCPSVDARLWAAYELVFGQRIILGGWATIKSICTLEIEVMTFRVYVIRSRIEAPHYVSTSCSASDRFSTNLNPAVRIYVTA
jgi:hypothetical protein